MENWKDIKGFERSYQISNLGNVKSFKRNKILLMNPTICRKGYRHVSLWKNNKNKRAKVSLLVWDTFDGSNRIGFVIDHKDEVKTNDALYNLQRFSNRQNISKSKAKFRDLPTGVSINNWGGKKYIAQIQINGISKNLGTYDSKWLAALAYQKCLISNGLFNEIRWS